MRRFRACVLLAAICGFCAMAGAADPSAPPGLRPWNDYRTILWISDSAYRDPAHLPAFFQSARDMGINTAMVHSGTAPEQVFASHLPYYVENMVNEGLCLKWNSNVRDWDKFVTAWAKKGRPVSGLIRDYCLDDPAWQAGARTQMEKLVRQHMGHQPVAYDIRDELSTTVSANPFDYDFNPLTLAAFRTWLKSQYKDLAALNAEWDTSFATWEQVKPFTTDQIKNRMATGEALPRGKPNWHAVEQIKFDFAGAQKNAVAWNFAPWADFRSYMDLSLARTLNDFRSAAHRLDPATPVGIEGTQMPDAFGGYDLWRLSQSLDWVEPYDVGNAREIWGSFMPGRPILTTVGESSADAARRRLWHLLLEGDKGCIVWWSEDTIDAKADGAPLTAKGNALAPVLKEMTSPLAALFLRATPQYDPIYLHYSQASIQVDWLMESTVDGSTWLRRFSSFEGKHNRQVKVRDTWLKAFEDLGYSPRFISSEQIDAGGLGKGTAAGAGPARVLVLPCDWALSTKEAAAIDKFVGSSTGGATTLFADGAPGLFDAHGKLRSAGALKSFSQVALSAERAFAVTRSGPANAHAGDIAQLAGERLGAAPDSAWLEWIAAHCPIRPAVSVQMNPPESAAAVRTRVHRYKLGHASLLAFERNIEYQMSENLKQAGGNQNLEKPVQLEATLPAAGHVYDLRTQRYLGHTDHIRFTLDPWQPSLFAVVPERLPADKVVDALLAVSAKPQ